MASFNSILSFEKTPGFNFKNVSLEKTTFVLACALSLCLSMCFWWGLGHNILMSTIFVLTAIVLESAKIVCARTIKKSIVLCARIRSLVFACAYVVLLSVSLFSSCSQLLCFVLNEDSDTQKHKAQVSNLIQLRDQQQKYIKIIVDSSRMKSKSSSKAKSAIEERELLKKSQKNLIEIQEKINTILSQKETKKSPIMAACESFSGILNLSTDFCIKAVCLALALMLDFVVILMAGLLMEAKKEPLVLEPVGAVVRHIDSAKSKKKKKIKSNDENSCSNVNQSILQYQHLKRLISSGECFPNIRNIKSSLQVGNQKAQQYLAWLKTEGLIVSVRNRYCLAS